jgi:hypothetical protein
MQGIYTYISETNLVPRENSIAAILLLLFMVPISLVPALLCGLLSHQIVGKVRICYLSLCSIYYYCCRISHFSALAGKYSPILGCNNQQD